MEYLLPVLLQLMVVGQAGAHGRLVMKPVEQGFRSVLGAALNRRPDMAGKSVTGIRGKAVSATHTCAPVRTTTGQVFAVVYIAIFSSLPSSHST